MDKLTDVGTVQSALAEFKTAVTNLKNTINDLQTNKNNISNSWESNNASSFLTQYNSLINSLTEAFGGLDNYQQKIDAVVKEFIGFDTTIK